MTQEEINKRNSEIALMLGWVESNLSGTWYKNDSMANYVVYSEHNNYPHKRLPFHRDWNWLMEAVEFIQKELIKNNDEFCIEFYKGLPGESMTFVSYAEQSVESKSSKEAVFTAVSDFAKLHNEIKAN